MGLKIHMIRREGGSRIVSISKVVPKDWQAVNIEVIKSSKQMITLKFIKVQ